MSDISLSEVNAEIDRRKQLEAVNAEIKRRQTASGSSRPAQPMRNPAEAKAQGQAAITASLKSQGITEADVRKKGTTAAVEGAKTAHEDAQSRALSEAALKATHDAQVYRLHGGGMGYNKAEQAKERAAAQQSSAKLQAVTPNPGTLLNQIQPHFDETLAQQQGKKGAVYDKAAGLLNSIPDLAAIAATEGLGEIPAIGGQSLVTRGFQAQQVAGLAHEAADQKLRKEDPGKYFTSLLLGGLLVGAPDITSHASKALTDAVETQTAKQATNVHGGPSVSAKEAAAPSAEKVLAAKKARGEAAAKAKTAADIARVKVDPSAKPKTTVNPPETPQVKAKAESKPVEAPKTAITPEHVKAHAKDGFTKAADLYAEAKKTEPKLTKAEFAQRLYEFHKAHGDSVNYEGGSGDVKAGDIFIAKNATGEPVRYYGFSEKTSAKPIKTKTEPPPTSEKTVPDTVQKKPELDGKTENQPKTEVPGKKPETAFKPTRPKAEDVPKKSPTDGHNTTNARAQQVRASMGLADLPPAQRQTWAAVVDHVEKTGMDRDADNVADRVLKGGHAMSAEEVMANNYRQHTIMHEVAELRDQIDEGIKAGHDVDAKKIQALELEKEFEKLTDATKRTGTLTSHALNIRKAMIPKYSYDASRQRIFHADPSRPLTEAETKNIKDQTDIINEGKEKLADKEAKRVPPDEKRSLDASAENVRELKKQTRTARKEDLDKELQGHLDRLVKVTSQLNAGIDPAVIPILKDIAINRLSVLKDVKVPELIEAVHAEIEKHPQLKGLFTPREVRDALSGYGQDAVAKKQSQFAELKTEMRLISELEDAKAGVAREKKIAAARAKPPRIEALKQAIKGERAKTATKPPTPAPKPTRTVKTPAEKRLQAQTQAIGKQIEEYDRRIKNADFSKKPGVSTPDHPDITALKARRDALKSIYDSMKPKPIRKAQPTRLETLERQFKTLKEKNAKRDYGTDPTKIPDTPEEAEMRAKLNAARRERGQMRKAQSATPPKDPTAAYKKGLQKQLDQLNGELNGTRAKGPKADPPIRDKETEDLKLGISKAQKKLDAMERNRQPQSFQDKFIAYRRFAALSRIGSWSKLGAAAGERILFGPVEEVAGLPARYLAPSIERKAMTQGRPSLRAEKGAVNKYLSPQTWTKEAVDKFQTGRNSLDVRYGKDDYSEGEGEKPTILNMPGRLHGAIKTPAQMAAFERAQIKGTEWAERQGLDVSDPLVQGGVDARAYQESLRAILMQDNVATDLYKSAVTSLEKSSHPAGKAAATAMRAFMPIVKVPTNFAGEVGLHLGGAVRAAWEVKVAGGVKNLTPEQADIVLRSLKKQGVGGMMFAIGYFNPDQFGGLYTPDTRRKPGDPEYGSIGKIPHNLLHNPAIEALQIGATWRRVQDEELHKRAGGHPFLGALTDTAVAELKTVPFADAPVRLGEALHNKESAWKWAGQEAGSELIPGAANEAGALFNKDAQGKQIKRNPQGFWDEIKMAAGFQATVPTSSPSTHTPSLPKMNADGIIPAPRAPRGMALPKL